MQIATQLALFLENRPGTLARVCNALAEQGINILAVSTSDTVDHTVVRMVVSDPRKALFLFEERGTLVVESEVLLVEAPNKPGALGRIAAALAKGKVNIDYLYCAATPSSRKGVVALRVSNPKRALGLLQEEFGKAA